MSRLEYLESRFGSDVYRDFLKKISTEGQLILSGSHWRAL